MLLDFHHGMGDEVICNGLVRECCKKYAVVGIFCLERNYPSVLFMYRDLTNLRIHVVRSHKERYRFRFFNPFRIGRNHYDEVRAIDSYDQESGIRFERQVYKTFDVPLEKKWESFFVGRDRVKEEALFQKAGLSQPYLFVHDDARYPLNLARISPALKLFRPNRDLTDNIFDYCTAIERAAGIHVIDSSFMNLIECLPYTNTAQLLYMHRYARTTPLWALPMLKKPWIELSQPL